MKEIQVFEGDGDGTKWPRTHIFDKEGPFYDGENRMIMLRAKGGRAYSGEATIGTKDRNTLYLDIRESDGGDAYKHLLRLSRKKMNVVESADSEFDLHIPGENEVYIRCLMFDVQDSMDENGIPWLTYSFSFRKIDYHDR